MTGASSGVEIVGWREAAEAEMSSIYRAERARWIEGLDWDPQARFAAAEAARAAGADGGLVARGAPGAPAGWVLYGKRRGELGIHALSGDGPVVADLLGGVFSAAAAARVSRLSCFLYPFDDVLAGLLARHGFALGRQRYLRKELSRFPSSNPALCSPPAGVLVPAGRIDEDSALRLMARAYAGTAMAARFAPRSTLEEWAEWLQQVRQGTACGRLMPEASHAVEDRGGRPLGMILTTTVRPGVAHVAQVVVAPAARRRGLARLLLDAACLSAAAAGCGAVTLLVTEENAGALELYHACGFREAGELIFGTRAGLKPCSTYRCRAPGAGVPQG